MSVENAELGRLLGKSPLPLPTQIYVIAIICLMGGIALGYLCRGTDTNVAPAPAAVQSPEVVFR
jgi:hypothetical protein